MRATFTVTVPSGKRYTFAGHNGSRARALADRTGGTLTYAGPNDDDGHDRARDAALEAGFRRNGRRGF